MPSILNTYYFAWLIVVVGFWIYSVLKKDAGIADVLWGLHFVFIAGYCWVLNPTFIVGIVSLCTIVWGLRLTVHLFMRNHNKSEDRRYTDMRNRSKLPFWLKSLFTVFLLQWVIASCVGIPLLIGLSDGAEATINLGFYFGFITWLIGFMFEAIGDWQLKQFLKNGNDSGVLNTGLWKYTRHPNYFGDALLWWGIAVMCFNIEPQMILFVGPTTMTFFLLKVSGVSMLEKDISNRRPEYQKYIRSTPAFIPWFPKKES